MVKRDKKKNIRRSNIIQLILGLAIIILVNIISEFIFTRVDLTAEKRYSLSSATKKLVKKLDDVVFFKVYLDGDLPPGFQRLSNETREMLNEFRAYSDNIQFEFVNPSESQVTKERNDTYRLLAERGLQPTELRVNKKGESSQLIIFPGAMVSYKGREVPVQLLMTQIGQDPERVLNNSIQALEYNLASAIQKLTTTIKPRIAFIEGHDELTDMETIDLHNSLSEFYNVDRVVMNEKITSLALRLKVDSARDQLINKYRAIIIAKPLKPFSEKDKFLIDQFVMRGGKVLWLIDPVFASMDSLEKYNSTMGIANDINLEDLLFNYGVRMNTNLVMDMTALPIPVRTGQVGNQPQLDFFPWYYFPVLTPMINHPIVNGLNAVRTEYLSSLDTLPVPGVRKQYLLTSSPYSRTVNAPAYIDLEILKKEPDERMFNKGPQPVAALLEGEFVSAFLYRIPPELAGNQDLGFRGKSKPTRMIVVTDGDVAKNQFHYSQGYPLPLGYDQWTRKTFGNKDFLLNAMNYLCDDSGLISVRSRELKMRMLDSAKLANQRLFWQLINVLLPILLILLLGITRYRIRKHNYARVTRKK
jgi:ABC-2 type transport system permease protein